MERIEIVMGDITTHDAARMAVARVQAALVPHPALGVILCCFCEDSVAHHSKARA